jgi:hypothetical protein
MIPDFKNPARAVLIAAAAVFSCFGADLYPVAGMVLNAGTNSPLPHARVYFYRSTAAEPVASTITGDDGRFQFQLPAGSYDMRCGTRDTWENYGSRHPSNSVASAVVVGPGKDAASLVFRFFPPAAISGRVLDDSGEPVRDALVQLIRSSVTEGRRSAAVFAYERTNDLGEYRFGRLPGDTPYFLAVTGEPWYTQSSPADVPGTKVATAYAPIYYPDTGDASKAVSIPLKQGEEARADFRLTTVPNATITIRHDAPSGMKGTLTLGYDGVAGTTATQQSQQLLVFDRRLPREQQDPPAQTQILQSVPPGHYTVSIVGVAGGSALGASAAVDVNGSDVTVDLALKPPPKVEGTLHLAPGVVQSSAIGVSIRGEASGSIGRATVQSDGSFRFSALMPGRFRVSLGGTDGFFASQIEARGGTIRDGLLEVSEGSDVSLSVTASNATGEVRGFVVDGDRPLEGVLVVLAPAPAQKGELNRDARYHGYQTESDGSFNFRSIPAGRYLLFAVDNSQLEYARPDIVGPYLSRAREIDIGPRTVTEERIPLASPLPTR